MAFDEDLQRAFDVVITRLRGEMARVSSEVSASAGAARDEAVRAALQDAEREAEERLSAAVAAAEAYAIERAIDEGKRQKEEGMRLGREEGRQEGRAAGMQEGRLQGLQEGRLEGLQEGRLAGLDQGRLEGQRLAEQLQKVAVANAVSDAVGAVRGELRAADLAATGRLTDAIGALDRGRSLTEILDALVTSAARETARAAVVVARDGRFRGWRFAGFGPEFDAPERIEFGAAEAGVIGEAMRADAAAANPTGSGAAPAFADLPPARASVAMPLVMGGQVVAVLYADEGPDEGADDGRIPAAERPERWRWTSTLEILARHGGRCLEAITAFRAASVAAERRRPAQGQSDGAPIRDGRDEASAAERYARLLVSEIKLYHEADVIAGRRERDLMTRLGGEIERARGLYEQRVPAAVRKTADHFHAELVRMLANGDESLLEARTT